MNRETGSSKTNDRQSPISNESLITSQRSAMGPSTRAASSSAPSLVRASASPPAHLTRAAQIAQATRPRRRRRTAAGPRADERPHPHDGRAQHRRRVGHDPQRPDRGGRRQLARGPKVDRPARPHGRARPHRRPRPHREPGQPARAITRFSRTRPRFARSRKRWPRAARACPRASGSRRWAAGTRTSGPSIAIRR